MFSQFLVFSLSDYASVASKSQESLAIVRVDSNFSLVRDFVEMGLRRAYPLCSDPAVVSAGGAPLCRKTL